MPGNIQANETLSIS